MKMIYACYISGNYLAFVATEKEAQEWASSNFNEEYWLQGQYEELEVSSEVAAALLREQPCCGYEEALTYQ